MDEKMALSKLNLWILQGIEHGFKTTGYGISRYCHGIPASYAYRTRK